MSTSTTTKRSTTKKAASSSRKASGKAYRLPTGYVARWTKPGYDLLQRTASAKGDGPAWYVTCNAHGDMTAAKSGKEGDALGTAKARATWCTGDHEATAPATAKSAAKKATSK